MYTICEAGKRRTVNHVRALVSPSRAEAEAVAVAEAEARRACTDVT
jgi:hypothetical protein